MVGLKVSPHFVSSSLRFGHQFDKERTREGSARARPGTVNVSAKATAHGSLLQTLFKNCSVSLTFSL